MMLIADSGSTKTDWAWIENGTIVHRVTTAGINPVHQGEEDIEKVVEQLFPRKNTSLKWVFFYGAGCIPEKKGVVEKVLRKVWEVNLQMIVLLPERKGK
jgi:pantothenate kinase type III